MKINFLDNGVDSLKKGFESLNKYEELRYITVSKIKQKERFYFLKDSILFIQHGIEILFKNILHEHSEYLLFSQIDFPVRKAIEQKNSKKLNSVFESDYKNKIRTVSFKESIERLKMIPAVRLSKTFEKRLIELENYRNIIMHSEPFLNETEINNTFNGLSDELDIFFIKNIGKRYRTISGYSELIKNIDSFKKVLLKKNLELKTETLNIFQEAIEESRISIGSNQVKRFTDINKINKFLNILFKSNLNFGTDLYNGFCSGEVNKFKRKEEGLFEFYTTDNDCYFEFKLKSMIFYLPEILNNTSPLIFLESDDVDLTQKKYKNLEFDDYEGIKQINSSKDKATGIYNYFKDDDEDYDYNHNEDYVEYVHFLTKGLFCFFNVQGLDYNGNFSLLIQTNRFMSGKELEVHLRKLSLKENNTTKY